MFAKSTTANLLLLMTFPQLYEVNKALQDGLVTAEELAKGLKYVDGTYTIKGIIGLSAYQDVHLYRNFSAFRPDFVSGQIRDFMTKEQYLDALNVLNIRL